MGENVYIRDLIDFDVTMSTSRGKFVSPKKCLVWFMKYSAYVRRIVADFSHAPPNEYSPSPDDKKQWSLGCWFGGKLIQKLRQKGVYEESFSRHAAWIGGKLIQFMHTTMVPVQVKTMKIQAGVQVSRQGELRRHLQFWKTLFLLYLYLIGTLKPKRKDTQIPQSSGPTEHVADEAVYKELDDSLVMAATTTSNLEAEQDSGNIAKTQSKATPNESSSLGTTLSGGPGHQETMGDTIAQTRFENVSKHSNDSLLERVLDLEKTKTTQTEEIVSLKRRVKKLEQKKRSRTHGLKRLYKVGLTARVEYSRDEESLGEDASKQGRINAIDADEDITLVNDQDDADMFDLNTLTGDEVLAEQEVATKDVILTVDEVTLAQALSALKSVKSNVKGDVIKSQLGTSTTTTTISSQPSQEKFQDKGKGIMVEPEKPLKKKDQISFHKQEAIRLQAKFDEEERLTRKKDGANVALTEEWDDIQAKVDVDYQLAQRLQAEEQEQFTTEQKATLSKVDDDQEAAKIKELMKIVPDEEEVAINAIPLATKPSTIVDWKIHKEGKKNYYQVIRADGSSKMYLVFSHMLKIFNREDFETLWKLVKAKYGSTRPVEDLDLIL
ncbi:hypothetical protein Tco_1122570 [Tanacetum coccineum]|uniref:Uncharacterized protein n=1 Tax=Tanacetum coccineum TaxID=301880 RepID=A0ABQ5J2J4_9ASTR